MATFTKKTQKNNIVYAKYKGCCLRTCIRTLWEVFFFCKFDIEIFPKLWRVLLPSKCRQSTHTVAAAGERSPVKVEKEEEEEEEEDR